MWEPAPDVVAGVWPNARAAGFALELLNIGGGFPTLYSEPVQEAETHGSDVLVEIRNRIGDAPGCIMAEPGPSLVAQAG